MQCLEIGVGKANTSALKIFLMAIMGGAFVSIGGFLALTVGANCPGLAASNPGLQKMVFGAFGKKQRRQGFKFQVEVACPTWSLAFHAFCGKGMN